MFGFFKGKEKKIGQAAANIASLLNTYFWSIRRDNNGELPKKLQTDKYILGYIGGMTYEGSHAIGLNKSSDKEWLMANVFMLFFPDNGEEVITEYVRLANAKDQLFKQGLYNGTDESAVIYKAMMSGDEEAVKNTVDALKSLKIHLNENYQ